MLIIFRQVFTTLIIVSGLLTTSSYPGLYAPLPSSTLKVQPTADVSWQLLLQACGCLNYLMHALVGLKFALLNIAGRIQRD